MEFLDEISQCVLWTGLERRCFWPRPKKLPGKHCKSLIHGFNYVNLRANLDRINEICGNSTVEVCDLLVSERNFDRPKQGHHKGWRSKSVSDSVQRYNHTYDTIPFIALNCIETDIEFLWNIIKTLFTFFEFKFLVAFGLKVLGSPTGSLSQRKYNVEFIQSIVKLWTNVKLFVEFFFVVC